MILVTGAAGRIGSRLVHRLTQFGPVRALHLEVLQSDDAADTSISHLSADIANIDELDAAFEGVSAVFHLAAATSGPEQDHMRNTLVGTRNVIQCCIRHRVQRLLYFSSMSVLHLSAIQAHSIVDESWPPEPEPELRGNYTRYKLLAEREVQAAVHEHALPACIVRPGEVLFPDDPHLSMATALPFGPLLVCFNSAEASVPMVTIDDLLDAVPLLYKHAHFSGEIIHIVDPYHVTQRAYIEAYRRRTHGGILLPVPFPLVLLLSHALASLLRPVGARIPITPYRLRSAIGPRVFASDRLRAILPTFCFKGVQAFLEQEEPRSHDCTPS